MIRNISCTYIGHTTTLVELGKTTILTDPNFSGRLYGQKRLTSLPLLPGDLPKLSCVVISHAHFDHLDISSFKFLSCHIPIIVPEGNERAVGRYLPNPVIELSHYSDYELADGTRITALPVAYGSSAYLPWSSFRANAYLIDGANDDGKVYFCGDSAYGSDFKKTKNIGAIELALLPIGSYKPQWLMQKRHMNPTEAVQAFDDLKAKHMIPVHHSTFRLSFEKPEEPIKLLNEILKKKPALKKRVHPLVPGEKFVVPGMRKD